MHNCNQTIYYAGLIDGFDDAISKKDGKSVIDILKQIGFTVEHIDPILKQMDYIE